MFFFFPFFSYRNFGEVKPKIAKLVEFTLEKQNFPNFSQFLYRRMAKFRQKKNTDNIIIIFRDRVVNFDRVSTFQAGTYSYRL